MKWKLVAGVVVAAAATAAISWPWLSGLWTAQPAVLIGSGQISACSNRADEATARLLDGLPGTVFTLGDNAMGMADATTELEACFGSSWGRHKARMRPAAGEHEYETPARIAAYRSYFGTAVGEGRGGYYSYGLGDWTVVVLNSNCDRPEVGGCDAGSRQVQWLFEQLRQRGNACTLAYWHHPLFSSGAAGGDARMQSVWRLLYALGVDVVVSGHDQNYERFAPQDPSGARDERGPRQFVVGTGGQGLRPLRSRHPNSEAFSSDSFGVVRFTLHAERYEWEFIPVEGGTFVSDRRFTATYRDAGSGSCISAARDGRDPTEYGKLVLDDGPSAYWPLDETEDRNGIVVAELVAGRDGLYERVSPGQPGAAASSSGGALGFNGTNAYVTVGHANPLSPTGDMTVEAWARPAEAGGGTRTIVHKGDGPFNDTWEYRLAIRSGAFWEGCVFVGREEQCVEQPMDQSAVGQWSHLALSRREGVLTLYVNGSAVGSRQLDGAPNLSDGVFSIGRSGREGGRFFRGAIDEVAVYGRALSPERISAHATFPSRAVGAGPAVGAASR
ncbi:MAG: LamG-like jellyroll fold domain-containing protein [Chloroflexota bacterium]